MQIHKSDDFRVNEIAQIIEELQDYKHHIKPFDIAKTIVRYIDQVYGKGYAKKIDDQVKDFISFSNNKV